MATCALCINTTTSSCAEAPPATGPQLHRRHARDPDDFATLLAEKRARDAEQAAKAKAAAAAAPPVLPSFVEYLRTMTRVGDEARGGGYTDLYALGLAYKRAIGRYPR